MPRTAAAPHTRCSFYNCKGKKLELQGYFVAWLPCTIRQHAYDDKLVSRASKMTAAKLRLAHADPNGSGRI
jgi:hypothetical protein